LTKETPGETSSPALEGIRILEYCSMVSGPFCTRLMADLGAEVTKIEPPGAGDKARQMPPFPGDIPCQDKSGFFFYLNTNKRGITLDPAKARGREIFRELAKYADVLVEDRPPGEMEALGLGYDELKKINPGLIMASITPFGRTGPFKDYKAYPLNTAHASGQAYLLPLPSPDLDRPPVKPGGHISDYDPGLVAAVAVLGAIFWKGISGQGQFIELSKQEALISMQRVESVTYANDQVVITRMGHKDPLPGGLLPCKDGHVVIIIPEDHQWKALMELMGNPEWSQEPWCQGWEARRKNSRAIHQRLVNWTMRHTKEEIFRKGQALGCPISPCHSAEDIIKSEQLEARGFFKEIDHPELGRFKFPTSPYRLAESPWEFRRAAPLLGESNEEVYCGLLGYRKEEIEKLKKEGVI
jgi:crotonobetainyl-CoA:carnitine CoA-transferase CaiB-like acyl-CoA transferase